MLRDQAFEAHQAGGRNRSGAYLALFKGRKLDASTRRARSRSRFVLPMLSGSLRLP